MKGVVGAEELAQATAGVEGLFSSIWGELHSVIGGCLVDFTVFWAGG